MRSFRHARTTSAAAVVLSAALLAAGCSAAGTDTAATTPTTLTLADAQELGSYNPVNGYGELGVSPLYDGLLRPASDSDEQLPDLVPALAAADPVPNAASTTWNVELREDVTFSDGTPFDADDVVATYEAVLDPASASEIAGSFSMIDTVTAVDEHHVRFDLKYPYYAFPARLTLGIAPAEAITAGPAADSPLNTHPIGTGPYTLASLSADQAVFEANPHYWGGAPQIEKLV
ncbi:MAG: ABC transporter substrate-binding protein, partial [Tomitella sp.]|nr:ABC transporter substrate-binding protein [Tomitella sp.]